MSALSQIENSVKFLEFRRVALRSRNWTSEKLNMNWQANVNSARKLIPTSHRMQLEQWVQAGELYALVDAFFEVPVPVEKVRLETKDTDPLFYDLIAWDKVTYEPPVLVKLTPVALEWFLNSLSLERWGLFVASKSDIHSLAQHFQKFVIARGPDANPYFLRFHDAAVLEILLRTWDPKERATFFGPAHAFALPDLDSVDVVIEENPTRHLRKSPDFPPPEECLVQLRDSQLKLCAEAIDRDLVKVIYWHMRNHHSRPVQFLDRNGLEARVRVAITRARKYGLGTISDLAGYTALMFELAPNFDQHPSFKRVLEDQTITNETKMRRLSQVISDTEWNEAAASYDRHDWAKALAPRKK
jgi:hypothetical protein